MFGGTLTKSITINDIKIELYDLEGVSYAEWNNNDIYYSYTASSEENIEKVLKYLIKWCYNYNVISMDYIKRIEELERNAKNITLQQDVKQAVKPMIVCKGFIGKNAIIKPYFFIFFIL